MQKTVKFVLVGLSFFLASCGAKTSDANNTIAEKKTQLEDLKKQQQKLSGDIAALEAEIVKLDPSSKTEKTKLVSVAPVTPQNFTHYIELQGTIDAEDISYVAPRNGQGGLVKQIFIKKGDNVKKGQQILKLDDAVYLTNLKQAQSQLAFAEDLYRRQKNLWDQQIGTEIQLVQAKQNVDQIEDQIATGFYAV